jgi:uncharacterized protein (TIGR02466 family)
MEFKAIHPFPPIVFKAHYDGFTEAHVEAAKEIMAGAPEGGRLSLEVGNAWSSVHNQNSPPHHHSVFKDFYIWQHKIATEIMFGQLYLESYMPYWITNSWVNLHKKDGFTYPHAHGMCSLSIAAYLQLPQDSGFIEFKDPHFDMRSIQRKIDIPGSLEEYQPVAAVTGDVLFFTGWLQHRTQPNYSDEDRWVLTTNYSNVEHRKKPQRMEL